MNIPLAAVRSIASSSNVAVQSECIDENSLGVFEDSYIRKLRTYFKRVMRNASEMGYSDLCTFIQFCKTFKKPDIDYKKICQWEDIDEDAIRKQFREDVRRKSKRVNNNGSDYGIPILFGRSHYENQPPKCYNREFFAEHSIEIRKKAEVLCKVTHSYFYHRRDESVKLITPFPIDTRSFIVSAHYYIYCREDKNDHYEDTVSSNCQQDYIINCIYRMVA